MKNIISYETFENKLIEVDNQLVLLDKDVAALYRVETKVLNQALKTKIELNLGIYKKTKTTKQKGNSK